MADLNLRVDYKDDILDSSVNTKRKYNIIENEDGTKSLEDVSVYTQNGDSFGAADINKTNQAVLDLNSSLNDLTNGIIKTFLIEANVSSSDNTVIDYPNGVNKKNCILLGGKAWTEYDSFVDKDYNNGIYWGNISFGNKIVFQPITQGKASKIYLILGVYTV